MLPTHRPEVEVNGTSLFMLIMFDSLYRFQAVSIDVNSKITNALAEDSSTVATTYREEKILKKVVVKNIKFRLGSRCASYVVMNHHNWNRTSLSIGKIHDGCVNHTTKSLSWCPKRLWFLWKNYYWALPWQSPQNMREVSHHNSSSPLLDGRFRPPPHG